MAKFLSCIVVLLLTGPLRSDDPEQSVVSQAFGKNFERNSIRLARSLSKGRPSPSDILKEPDVRTELRISKEQVDKLAELDSSSSTFPEILALAGLDDGKQLAKLDEKQAIDAGGLILRELELHQAEREKKVKAILTSKQYNRMREIFLQKMLLFGPRNQVAGFLGLEKKAIVMMNRALQEADKKIEADIQKLKWRRYLEEFDEQLGPGTSRKSFGQPFYVDAEYREAPKSDGRRRRNE